MLSKKVYIEFARMIRKQRHQIENGLLQPDKELSIENQQIFETGALQGLESVVNKLLEIFQNDNPAFDADKFLSACEIKEESK